MSSSITKLVGIACTSMLLQFGASAQNPAETQTQTPKSSTSSGNTSSTSSNTGITGNFGHAGLNKQLALVNNKASDKALDKTANKTAGESLNKPLEKTANNVAGEASNKIAGEAKIESKIGSVIKEPKVSLKNPSVQFGYNPSETKLNGRPFASPSLDILGDPLNFQATAYALRGRTRSGVYVRRGVIAADPRVIPLGSVVQIKTPGYTGVYSVQDTGKKIKGKIIDVWVGSSREARIFGRRQVKLHVLRLGKKKQSGK